MKSIEFHEQDAVAIYFYDVTHHIASKKLTNEVQEHMTRHNNIANSHLVVSHEFRSPLTSSLMLLESLLLSDLVTAVRGVVLIVISQINLLISLVNDQFDLHLIEEGKF